MLSSSFLSALAFSASATAFVLGPRALSGQATYYTGDVSGGACSFSTYTIPSNLFGTALSTTNWDKGANCGRCVSVTGPAGNSMTAIIVDSCPTCELNQLDLFPDAFSALASQDKGVIPISWVFVDCPITTPLRLLNKDSVSAYWFSMQVVNANKAVKTLEVSTDGGATWKPTTRTTYNFFESAKGFGTTTVDVRVTSVDGDTVVVKSVKVSSSLEVSASENFGSSGSVPVAPAPSVPAPVVPVTPAPTTPAVAVPVPSAPVVIVAPISTPIVPTSEAAPIVIVAPTPTPVVPVIPTSEAAPIIASNVPVTSQKAAASVTPSIEQPLPISTPDCQQVTTSSSVPLTTAKPVATSTSSSYHHDAHRTTTVWVDCHGNLI